MSTFFLQQQKLQQQQQNGKSTENPPIFGEFLSNELLDLDSPEIKILAKVLSEYTAGGLSKNEKAELRQINELFKEINNTHISIDQSPWGKVIPGEISLVDSNGKSRASSVFFNAPEAIQSFCTDKSKIIAEALKQYSLDGMLTDQEMQIIGNLSNIMQTPNPIPSGVISQRSK